MYMIFLTSLKNDSELFCKHMHDILKCIEKKIDLRMIVQWNKIMSQSFYKIGKQEY